MTKDERLYQTIVKGVDCLKEKYKQISVVRKAATLGFEFDASTLTNIIKKRNTNPLLLQRVAKGIQAVVWSELGMTYQTPSGAYEKTAGPEWAPAVVPEKEVESQAPLSYVFHETGRPDILQKADFIKTARFQIIEFGIRLRTFSEYFISSNEALYKDHLKDRLQQGVRIDCYVLDPDSNEAGIYFADRARVQAIENKAISGAKTAMDTLQDLVLEFATESFKGHFKLWKYRHIPYNHFLAVDPETPHGKIQVAHYLYGIKRSDCPVLEVERAKNPKLFEKYWQSLQYLMKDAREISFNVS